MKGYLLRDGERGRFQTQHSDAPGVIAITVNGRLSHADYQNFQPTLQAQIAGAGPISLLVELDDFHGWDLHAAFDDLRFGMQYRADFTRIAMVGDPAWERWIALMAKPFMVGEIRCFPKEERAAARDWVRAPPA